MIKIKYIDPKTLRYRKDGKQQDGDLFELQFVHKNNHEKRFILDGFLHCDCHSRVETPELEPMEKSHWLLSIIHDELAEFVASKENTGDYLLQYLFKSESALFPQKRRVAVALTLGERTKVHVVYLYMDKKTSSLGHVDIRWMTPEKKDIIDYDLRIHLPFLWNETLQMWNVYRQGDTCLVRFVYTPDINWYDEHMDFFTKYAKNHLLWHNVVPVPQA